MRTGFSLAILSLAMAAVYALPTGSDSTSVIPCYPPCARVNGKCDCDLSSMKGGDRKNQADKSGSEIGKRLGQAAQDQVEHLMDTDLGCPDWCIKEEGICFCPPPLTRAVDIRNQIDNGMGR